MPIALENPTESFSARGAFPLSLNGVEERLGRAAAWFVWGE